MTAIASDSSPSGLVFTGRLPLAWHELSALPDQIGLGNLERANLTHLHTLFALDIHAGDSSDDPVTLANATELKRLDFKVGLCPGPGDPGGAYRQPGSVDAHGAVIDAWSCL